MKKTSILFLILFGFYGNVIYGQNSKELENNNNTVNDQKYFLKYEADSNAVLTYLPKPKLTPEAIKNFVGEEIEVEMILRADGTVDIFVFRGTFKNGMHGRVLASIREIKFTPAKFKGKNVSQKVHIKYGIKKCENQKVCTYAFEFTP